MADSDNRGFASMDENKQREIASKGGKAQGKPSTSSNPANFANDRDKASRAGRKGGESTDSSSTSTNS